MLRNLLFKYQDKKQLYVALLGGLLGIVFTLISLHYLIKVNDFGEEKDALGPNIFIVQKKVSNSTSLNLGVTDFSNEELRFYKKQPFLLAVEPISSNNFAVSFETEDPLVPYFRSDVFIQSVDTSFLDVHSSAWKWNQTDSVLPIILPRDFLMMLNTFMSSSGIPVVSDEIAKDIKFKLTLSNERESANFPAKIIGFTNEVSSILVPQSFMKFGKRTFGNVTQEKVSQLILESKDGQFGLVESFFKSHHLEAKNAHLIAGKLKSMISILLSTILVVSILAMLLSCLVIIQYVQLLISKTAYEIRVLLRIGYTVRNIVSQFTFYLSIFLGMICIIGFVSFYSIKQLLDSIIVEAGLMLDISLSVVTIYVIISVFLIFIILTWLNAYSSVRKQF
ncbi:MAG: ABC transporter permease [Crocinitomicaceae bacterium]|nr:ABC transporter permease [Crocinitomicaceae bacterium]